MRFKDLQKVENLFILQVAVPTQGRVSPAIGPWLQKPEDNMDRQLEETLDN